MLPKSPSKAQDSACNSNSKLRKARKMMKRKKMKMNTGKETLMKKTRMVHRTKRAERKVGRWTSRMRMMRPNLMLLAKL